MSRNVKLIIITFAIILSGLGILYFAIGSIFDMCGTSELREYDSPNNHFTATSYEFGCGVASSTELTKIDITKKFLFIPYSTENAFVFDEFVKTELLWKSDNETLCAT
jgi:hypothetical protein